MPHKPRFQVAMLARAVAGLRLTARPVVRVTSAAFSTSAKGDDSKTPVEDDDETDPDTWLGFNGDLDAATEDGTATWLQAVRTVIDLKEEEKLEARRKRQEAHAALQITRVVEIDELGRAYGTGRRKTSNARVWIKPAAEEGKGTVRINKMDMVDYFTRDTHRHELLLPFLEIKRLGHFDVMANVRGGGLSGQAGAVRHGISRALEKYNPDNRAPLKKAGFMTRDPRMVERKKPGQKKARKQFQWVKR
ncbi:30S ribosomal protein S9 [Saprolegnia diclina VS20]|uniref:30S ribosomal protein S9 n=1 Tax=Saprolegnia diclina (strain VS20) TaxID=1156394 RepID=T0SCT7_SAPDV|nr:30S ribosomal protein S9 [Saprolegnia diclina VS20]EQC40682.1 30S ribosomal protein S9 [Saprolegnia diclina VS20]|eukprot:XP_008605526.1 30S ribosomal protein S9 [Saprolegnia diclina VS20]